MTETVALCDQRIRFQCDQVYIRVHCPCDLLNIIPIFDIFQYLVIRQGDLGSKDVCFVLHSALPHIENVKFLEAASLDRFYYSERGISMTDQIAYQEYIQRRYNAFCKTVTVSYTHLDVYKRQVKPRLMEADADLEKVLVIDDRDTPLTLADERIARAIRENNARLRCV